MDLILRENAFLGETHIVTGGAQGIGFRVAEALARHGAQVAMIDLDAGRLAEARGRIVEAAVAPIVVAADVTKEDDVVRAVREVLEISGCINGLVNVAGITRDSRAAKGAIESVTRTAAREFSGYRVRVNAIAPGPVNTPMLAGVGEQGIEAMKRATLLGKIAEPEELAATVVGMACPRISGYTTGQVLAVNGGMYIA